MTLEALGQERGRVRLTHLAQLALLGFLWGSSYLLIKVALDGVGPLGIVFGRLVIGALILLSTVRLLGIPLPRHRVTLAHLTLMAVAGNLLPFLLITWAQQRVDSSVAAIMGGTTPLFTLLIAAGVFRTERWTVPKILGIVAGFLGVVVLNGADLVNVQSNSGRAVLALLASGFCYGLAFAYARRFIHGEPLGLAAVQLSIASVLLTPIVLATGALTGTNLTPASLGAWLLLGIFPTGVAYILYYQLIAAVGASRASYSTYLIPIVGIAWGWLLLDETFGINTLLGVLLIFAGLVIAGRGSQEAPAAEHAQASRSTAGDA